MKTSKARVALVTGANRGMGLETSRQLLSHGLHAAMTGRDLTRELTSPGQRPLETIAALAREQRSRLPILRNSFRHKLKSDAAPAAPPSTLPA